MLRGSCLCGHVKYEAEGPISLVQPKAHIFVEEKPAWSEITDSLPQFAREPTR